MGNDGSIHAQRGAEAVQITLAGWPSSGSSNAPARTAMKSGWHVASLNSGGPDPDDYFGRAFQTGGATNVYKYSNPALDAALTEARAAADPARRKALYDQAQRILACQGPVVHLAYGTLFAAIRAEVQGFRMNPTRSLLGLRDVTLAP